MSGVIEQSKKGERSLFKLFEREVFEDKLRTLYPEHQKFIKLS
jgi:hypothetical protein